jgi:hypothetical protein
VDVTLLHQLTQLALEEKGEYPGIDGSGSNLQEFAKVRALLETILKISSIIPEDISIPNDILALFAQAPLALDALRELNAHSGYVVIKHHSISSTQIDSAQIDSAQIDSAIEVTSSDNIQERINRLEAQLEIISTQVTVQVKKLNEISQELINLKKNFLP